MKVSHWYAVEVSDTTMLSKEIMLVTKKFKKLTLFKTNANILLDFFPKKNRDRNDKEKIIPASLPGSLNTFLMFAEKLRLQRHPHYGDRSSS